MTSDRFSPVRRVALIYAVVSFLWILFSDRAVDALFVDEASLRIAQTWKGWMFVLVTTALLYAGLKRLYQQLIDTTDEQLQASRREVRTAALLHALSESSPDAIFAKDLQGRYLLINRAAARLAGTTPEQVLGRDDSALFPPGQVAQVQANDHRAMELESPQTFEELLDTRYGPRTFLATKGPLRGADGVMGTFGVARDISEMVEARRRLEAGEQRYRLMFELSPQPMLVFDRGTLRFLAVNEAAVRLYGFDQEAFLGMSLKDIRPPDQIGAMNGLLDTFRNASRELRVGPVIHLTAAGCRLEVNLSFCDMVFEGCEARLALVHDVTEINRLARERDAAMERINSILSRVTDGFIALNPEQHLTYVNRQAATLIDPQAEPSSLIDKLIWDLLPGAVGTRYAEAFFTAMSEGRSAVVEDWFEPWQRWIEARIHPSPQGATVYFTDVSERKRVGIALERSQKELSALTARLMSQERVANQRIAQALHDQLGQQLGSARLYLDVVQAALENGEQVAPELVTRSVELVSGAITEVRHVLLDLRPPLLKEQGLAAALDNELRNSPAGGLGVRLLMDACEEVRCRRWPDQVEYAAFMIAREAIANAKQHAQARSVMVSLDGDVGFLCVRVEDDGLGIAVGACEGVPGHLGIVGMRERALAVGGLLSVRPRTGGGTLVDLTIEELSA